MEELIKVEENQIIVAEKLVEQIKNFEAKRKLIEEKEKEFKEELLKVMEQYNIKSWESPDKTLKITYIPETLSMIFDSSKFKEEHKDLYFEYQKESIKKPSIRMTIRGDE